MIKMIDTTYLW